MSDDRWVLKKTVKNPDVNHDWDICTFPNCIASGECTDACKERNHSDYTPQIIAEGHKQYLSMSESKRAKMIGRLTEAAKIRKDEMSGCIYPRCIQTGACIPECVVTSVPGTSMTPEQEKRLEEILHGKRDPRGSMTETEYRLMKGDTVTPEEQFARQLRENPNHVQVYPYGTTIINFAPGGPALFKRLNKDTLDPATENYPMVYVPTRAKAGDAGYDLYISRSARVLVGAMTDLHTDIAISLPPGYFGRITGRSSTLRKRGLLVNEGIIDNGYRGEMFIAVFNLSGQVVDVAAGERLAQLIIQRVEEVTWVETRDELPASDRGDLGFGSTGQ